MNILGEIGKALDDVGKQAGNFVQNANGAVSKQLDNAGKITQEAMLSTLDWAYTTTLNGIPGQSTLDEFVEDYLSKYDEDTAIEKLIQFQTTKAATSGFVAGLGGIITMPVTIPANITTVILFQMRMVAAIAKIRGYDARSDQVQTFVYSALAGVSISEIAKNAGINLGNKLALSLLKKLPGEVLKKINRAVGFRLATKFGSTGVINLGKMVPLVGAIIGGTFDTTTTLMIADFAKKTFTKNGLDLGDGMVIIKDVTYSKSKEEENEKLTVYYNPDCSKCKKLQVLLSSQDLDVKWVNYLEHPLTEVELAALLEKMDSQPSAVIRLTEEERAGLSEEELFQRLVAEPALLNRPIIEREQTAFLCRPLDIIKKKMPEYDWSAYV